MLLTETFSLLYWTAPKKMLTCNHKKSKVRFLLEAAIKADLIKSMLLFSFKVITKEK